MSDNERYLTQAAAAKHFGVTQALITRKKQQGKLVMKDGLVDIEESTGAFGGNGKAISDSAIEQQGGARQGPVESFADAQRRKEIALANLREMEHKQKAGELIEVAQVEKVWASIGQMFRDSLLSLPERIAPQLAALTDARLVRDKLRSELRNTIENLPEKIRNVSADQQAA